MTLPVFVLLGIAAKVFANVWRERHLPAQPDSAADILWAACQRVGARFGQPRRPGQTPREYATAVGLWYPLVCGPLWEFAEALGQLRYGPEEPWERAAALERMGRSWVAVQAAWSATARFRYPFRRWL